MTDRPETVAPWVRTPRWMFWKPSRRRWKSAYDFVSDVSAWEYSRKPQPTPTITEPDWKEIAQRRRNLEVATRLWATCRIGAEVGGERNMESYERNLLEAIRALDARS